MSYIKKLVMHGFKSFPRKTEVPFTPGINVILGPNGSGKSNISDAICFVLGRMSMKSMRAAKASNLIFSGSKTVAPAKEASVEIVFDNSQKTFSLETSEITIKRILRKNGQSIYKINNETKTRQEILSLLAQAGIDPQGFNIILQGEIQNFVRMQAEDRREVIEEVSGIAVYETRKEKSLHELEKTDERLKEITSILRERTAYLNNLEKERQQALKYKKLEADIKKLKASIINFDLVKKKKETEVIVLEIEGKNKELEKARKNIVSFETEIKNTELRISSITKQISESTGLEQEKLNSEIANLRAELAGLHVRKENYTAKLAELARQKKDSQEALKELEETIKQLKKQTPTSENKAKDVEKKKLELEKLESMKKRFYMSKSELKSVKERLEDKNALFQTYANESDFLLKQIETISIALFDKRSSSEKLDALRHSLAEKRDSVTNLLRKEVELEKKNYGNESEIENHNRILEKISKMDVCPVCKSKITPEHMEVIKKEIHPKIESLKKEISNADKELKEIYEKKELLGSDIEQISQEISKTDSDLSKLSSVEEKKEQIKALQKKSDEIKAEISELVKKGKKLEEEIENNSGIEEKYETTRVEIQDISIRTKETMSSEVAFKERETERLKIFLKQISGNEEELAEEDSSLEETIEEKEETLEKKKIQEEQLSQKFQRLISERENFQKKIRDIELEISKKQNDIHNIESTVNELKIDKARTDAEAENLQTELAGFGEIEIIKAGKEILSERLVKSQEIFSSLGSVNLRSLEVYDSIKKEYDLIKEKAEIINKEKEGIMKIIHEIDIKKKKVFMQTLKTLNELFSRNFSQLSVKGQVYLELENPQEPFEPGAGVQITVKTGHGRYFDVKSLSGGEQTLVALSLIFAIQEYRPYYFYLVDEIDAALDKRNSERLAGLLNKYMQRGQYIVISHNDEVISRATNLYGVSMHEGISKIISLKV
ncbi:MAG: chromosome segregation SMC family protein [Candidatus Pacearchaeota archaeon]|nr:chromosome segregation SMC family protein [Candidatus Pacearchaeota archaeon]